MHYFARHRSKCMQSKLNIPNSYLSHILYDILHYNIRKPSLGIIIGLYSVVLCHIIVLWQNLGLTMPPILSRSKGSPLKIFQKSYKCIYRNYDKKAYNTLNLVLISITNSKSNKYKMTFSEILISNFSSFRVTQVIKIYEAECQVFVISK